MTARSVEVSLAGPQDREDWDEVVRDSRDGEIYHLYAWKEFFENVFGHKCFYLLARDGNGRAVGLLPVVHLKSRIFGNFLVSVPCFNYCGALADNDDVFLALIEYVSEIAGQLDAAHVELRHRGHVQSSLPARNDKVSFRLAMPDTEDKLWSSFSSKLRSQVRRSGKDGATCLQGGGELLDAFYNVFSRNMRDLGTPVYPLAFFNDICSRFTDNARVFIVEMAGQPVAAGLTLGFKRSLEVPFASSLRSHNRYSPNMLLYWSMMQYGISKQHEVFDFGRCSLNSGPYRFKKQWGAEPEGLAWHYILSRPGELPQINPDNPRFRVAVNLWRRLPIPIANYLGPQVVKHIP